MLTILIFSLVFAHNDLGSKEPRVYRCHVENVSESSGTVGSVNIRLQAPGIAATQGNLNITENITTLECLHLQSPVQVNLQYLEKMHGDLTNQTVEKCTLQSMEVGTSAGRRHAVSRTCVLLMRHRTNFQRNLPLGEKVFLARALNRVIREKLPKLVNFAKGLTVLHVHQENETSEEGIPFPNNKIMLNRLKLGIIVEVGIACILLAFAIPYIVFVIFAVPCLCLCPARINRVWSGSRRQSAACVAEHDQTTALLTPVPMGTDQKPLEPFV